MRAASLFGAAALALAAPAAAAALCTPTHNVVVGPGGPPAAELHVLPGSRVGLEIPVESTATATLVFDTPACETVRPLPVGVPVTLFCELSEPGSYPYRVDGFGAGTGVVVVDPVDWVTLEARRRVVVYGSRAVLAGTAYPGQPCSPPPMSTPKLVVEGRAVGTARYAARARTGLATSSFPEARWRALVRPRFSSVYRALWSGHYSSTVRVEVRPRVTLRRATNRYLRVTVRSAHSYRGRWVALQRRTAHGWRFVRAVRLGRGSTTRFRLARRGVIRVYVPRAVAGRGYAAGFSHPLRLR